MKIAQEYALPVRQQSGELEDLGTLSSLLEMGDELRIGAKGVTIIGKNGTNTFCRFSQSAIKGIKAGNINQGNLGNLQVYGSTYADEQGVEQHRLVLGVPQGVFSTAVTAAEIQAAAKANPILSQTVSLKDINLVTLVA